MVLTTGVLAGLVLFLLQSITVIPLIKTAETYENASHSAHSNFAEDDEGWRPAEGWQRASFTVLATILTGISFASILFGLMAVGGRTIDAKHGALWGLAAFVCFSLAPALGLPPQPPGVPVAELHQRQLWWVGTVIASAVGIWLITGERRTWFWRACGLGCLLLPHLVRAPVAIGQNSVPPELIRRFTILSVASSGIFWILVGTLGGFIYSRDQRSEMPSG